MTHTNSLLKTAATFLITLVLLCAAVGLIMDEMNPMAWPLWLRVAVVLVACLPFLKKSKAP